jgi:putative ribosome biogenesis GTPase RsgA
MIIANKSDLTDKVAIREDQGIALAEHLDVAHFVSSAKTGANINLSLDYLTNRIYDMYLERG